MTKTGIDLAVLALAATGPAVAQDTQSATASFINMSGEKNGTATLTGTTKGVLIEIVVTAAV